MIKATIWMTGFTRTEQFATESEALDWVYSFNFDEFLVQDIVSGIVYAESN